MLLILNPLFIKGVSQIEINLLDKIINIQSSIDEDDRKIHQMTMEIQSNNSFNQIEMQQQVNDLIEIRNKKVDVFKELYDDYLLLDNEKKEMSFFQLIRWQSLISILIIVCLITLFIFLFNISFSKNNLLTSALTRFVFSSVLLILIGYSTYSLIFVRANQAPRINENNPDTVDRALAYMNRDQYGDWEILNWSSTIARPENTNWKRYTLNKNNPSFKEQLNFFTNYQINEMYLRYFAWQFAGKGNKDEYPWYIKNLNGN